MTLTLPPGEPAAGPWRVVPVAELVALVLDAAGESWRLPDGMRPEVSMATRQVDADRPRVVAVDGRGASGKSTLAELLAGAVPGSAVVHTDDLAWHEPLFGWGDLLADGVLAPLRAGRAVDLRPPQWVARGREGSVVVPEGTGLVVVEGTGASHREHAHLLDATVWVQADFTRAEQRGIDRDVAQGVNGDREQATAFWHDWMRAELAFFERQRPWERAAVVVLGTPEEPMPPGCVAVADPPAAATGT